MANKEKVMKKAEIKKIVLNLGGKEVGLTLEQAKELHGVLDKIFGKTVPICPSYPYPSVPVSSYYPIIWYQQLPYWHWEDSRSWQAPCGDIGSITYANSTATIAIC